jgi:molybdopterin-synthase adenylyltransferase
MLVFPAPLLSNLQSALLATTNVESCAIAFARPAGNRLLVGAFEEAPAGAYTQRTSVAAVLTPDYLLDVANRARAAGCSLVLAHSHPGETRKPEFSGVDDAGESRLQAFLSARAPGQHVALVLAPGGFRARKLGTREELPLAEIGSKLVLIGNKVAEHTDEERYDRQIRAFGKAGQQQIASLKVAVIGAGGTGSVTCQQLAYLGVRNFILVDFDHVEETNLNRIVGATVADLGELKTVVASRGIKAAQPNAEVSTVTGDVTDDAIARQLLGADIIFICTDSHASRAVINQIAYQYLIPAIDMGVSLSVRHGKLAYITGRVQALTAGLPCLSCLDLLDPETIRREMLTPEARAADPYITGVQQPQPAVVSLNSTMASLAVTMFLGIATDAPANARNQLYDGVNGTLKNFTGPVDPDCFVCSSNGALAKGDSRALPTRRA